MSENFNLIWGSNASQTTVWNDSDYQRGWETIGDTPPTAQQFDALQRRNDLKAQALNNTIAPIAEANDANNRKPQTVYNVGDMQYDGQLPTGWYLLCTVGGTSGDGNITFPTPLVEDASVLDGGVVWRLHKLSTPIANIDSLEKYLAESTGYGIISGCEPTISGLTVTVGAGIVHLADGTRKEIAETNVTLDSADPTNPRIDLVYIDSTGTVAKVIGTAVASPSAPVLPTGGISVAQVSVAAGATTGTVTDTRGMLARWYNAGVVNVKDFGAVGDGVHDDTEALRQALGSYGVFDYSGPSVPPSNNKTGRIVYFPPGNYKITDTLYVRKGTLVKGADCQSTRILTSANKPMISLGKGLVNGVVTNDSGGLNPIVDGLCFAMTSSTAAISVDGVAGFGIRNCWFFADICININGSTDGFISHCVADNDCAHFIVMNSNGDEYNSGHSIIISDCNVFKSRYSGIWINGYSDVLIQNCVFNYGKKSAIYSTTGKNYRISINNCHFKTGRGDGTSDNDYIHISLLGTNKEISISNCIFSWGVQYDIYAQGEVDVENCTFVNSYGNSVFFNSLSGGSIKNSTFRNIAGIPVRANTKIICDGCVFDTVNTARSGGEDFRWGCINIEGSADGSIVTNNVNKTTEYTVVVNGPRNVVLINNVSQNSNADAYLYISGLLCTSINERAYYAGAPRYLVIGYKARNKIYSGSVLDDKEYQKGDIIYYDAPNAGGFIGAICVTAGTPGTWKEFGAIQS